MVRLTDRPDMTLDVSLDIKQQHNNNHTQLVVVCDDESGIPIAQWVKHWPSDLVLPSLVPGDGNLFSGK